MSILIAADIDGQTFPVDLTAVTGLDALVYRQATGEELDARIGVLMLTAPDDGADWPLADRAVIKWLSTRQLINPDAPLAPVAASVTFLPAESGGDLDAPGDES